MPSLCVNKGVIKEGPCQLTINGDEVEVYIDVEYLVKTVLPAFKKVIKSCSSIQGECKDWSDSIKEYVSKNPKHVDAAVLTLQGELRLIELSRDNDVAKLATELNEKLRGTYLMLSDLNLVPNVERVVYVPVVGDDRVAAELQKKLSEALNNTSPFTKVRDMGYNFRRRLPRLSVDVKPCCGTSAQ
ncbi:hypothetical protein [Stygiolobus caldivivus]|uniref:Uncharacterized protein n=1 Tax=Stygiolobus caldivivus TaxID=2824673 RepID=A0A8D5ZIW4_9CREN|nr:hypothetical protein [Stygiolobus caldivivus]BCU69750.1 hypothetical protein KN1_10470 [Stygiolobus caldivivus]